MKPIISTRKNNRMASDEAKWRDSIFESLKKMPVKITLTKRSGSGSDVINISGRGDLESLIGLKRAHVAIEGQKVYIIPSMDGYWIAKGATSWGITLSNPEIVDALKPYTNSKYPIRMKLFELAGIEGFPMYYIDLNTLIGSNKESIKVNDADSQMYYSEWEEGVPDAI